MFTIGEISEVFQNPNFREDCKWVRQSLVLHRAKQPFDFDPNAYSRLNYFIETTLCSAPGWSTNEEPTICRVAAEIAELLSLCSTLKEERRKRFRIRSALLYELAELPSLASAVLHEDDLKGVLYDFFARKGIFGLLTDNSERFNNEQTPPDSAAVDFAVSADALTLADYERGSGNPAESLVTNVLATLAKDVSIGLSSTELYALSAVLSRRYKLATRSHIDEKLFAAAINIGFPAELWAAQIKALDAGLLDSKFDSWGLAAPTGTGKTFLSRLLILKTLQDNPDAKILYLVPSKALVHEVSRSLNQAFEHTDFKVIEVSPRLVEVDSEEQSATESASVVVLTPEKADLLLRLGSGFISAVSLVIVDEAHHIEAQTRGVLLEMYLWRIKRALKEQARVIFLSAVTPNIKDLAESMGNNAGGIVVNQRATRMRAGVYRQRRQGTSKQGWIDYSDGTSLCVVASGVESGKRKGLVQLAEQMVVAGPVLVVTKGKSECESLAKELQKWLRARGTLQELSVNEQASEVIQRLDSRLEREMYPSVAMRSLLPNRIAYHHAGLPPRVRVAVEAAIRANLVDYVFATTTLAEGVNFPFSTVIVQSLALREPYSPGRPVTYHPVTPRSFWNIAGRAGRPGFDAEGQVILFEPSLGLERVNAVLSEYLDSSMDGVAPVKSALATSFKNIAADVESGKYSLTALDEAVLGQEVPKEIHGTVNLIRVGLIHAKASGLLKTPDDILEGTFAAQGMTRLEQTFASTVLHEQLKVVDKFLGTPNALPASTVAELGLSIETLTLLRDYVLELQDWQIQNLSQLMFGGTVNISQARYVIGPVSSRMAELEGPRLGGLYSEVVLQWLSGVPLSTVRPSNNSNYRWDRLEDLISLIYSRVQYLLPWGLYATDRIVQEEASKRGISYTNDLRTLAYLSDAGVPSFDALRLVALDFERVDATRIAEAYRRSGDLSTGLDVVAWLSVQRPQVIERHVRGIDGRRIDYDLAKMMNSIREGLQH